jgi:3-hydroxybutyryl-CoA dehydrogenase
MIIKDVFIVGSGLMGSGIAQVCAQAGINVTLSDLNDETLSKAMKSIKWSVDKFIEKGKLSEDRNTILDRIQTTTKIKDAARADLAIEAVFENLELKQQIFQELDLNSKPAALLATNTSAIPITEMGAVTNRPAKVIGLHFFSPVPMMPVVEVIKGINTSEKSIEIVVPFIKKIGKEPIRVESDIPGFLMNRINLVSYVEAIQLLEKGIGSVEDIDKGIRLAFGRRMGPFETGDMVGLDVSFGGLMAIYQETRDMRYYPPQLLRRKVKAKHLGRKTGKGWYKYDGNKKRLSKP